MKEQETNQQMFCNGWPGYGFGNSKGSDKEGKRKAKESISFWMGNVLKIHYADSLITEEQWADNYISNN